MIFSPGNVSYGCVSDDASNSEIAEVLKLAVTTEQGNGGSKRYSKTRPLESIETGGMYNEKV